MTKEKKGVLSIPEGVVVVETHWGTAGTTTQRTGASVEYLSPSLRNEPYSIKGSLREITRNSKDKIRDFLYCTLTFLT